jgi:hypothetical protein
MVVMGGKKWPPAVPVLTPAQLPDGNVVNVLARVDGLIVYVFAQYPSPSDPPRLNYGRVQAQQLSPLDDATEVARTSP